VGPGLEDGMAGISRRSAPRCAGGVVREEKSGKEKSGRRVGSHGAAETIEKRRQRRERHSVRNGLPTMVSAKE
jgi:hypothetical protein